MSKAYRRSKKLRRSVASNWIGEKCGESRRLLTNTPDLSLGGPLTNRIPGFFDLLTRHQDYAPDSAHPLHFRTRINRGDQSRLSLLCIFLLGSKLWSA